MPEGRNPVDETPAAERGRQLARLVGPLPAAAQRELPIGPATKRLMESYAALTAR